VTNVIDGCLCFAMMKVVVQPFSWGTDMSLSDPVRCKRCGWQGLLSDCIQEPGPLMDGETCYYRCPGEECREHKTALVQKTGDGIRVLDNAA
jgi:hypothetical protein